MRNKLYLNQKRNWLPRLTVVNTLAIRPCHILDNQFYLNFIWPRRSKVFVQPNKLTTLTLTLFYG